MFGAVFALAALVAGPARADELPLQRLPRLEPPGRALVTTEDADAAGFHAANLAFLPAWDLRYTHVELPAGTTTLSPAKGDSLAFGLPLLFGLATGARVSWLRPPSATRVGSIASFELGFAYKLSNTWSVAATLATTSSPTVPSLDGAFSLGASLAFRPTRHLGLALVLNNANAPRGTLEQNPSLDVGLGIRPFGTRALDLNLESRVWLAGPGSVFRPRAVVGVDVPYVGRALASLSLEEVVNSDGLFKNWVATAGLELGYRSTRLGAGALFGKGLSGPGVYGTLGLSGFVSPGLPTGSRGVIIRLDETPGARGHVRLLRKLARLSQDGSVKAIALVAKSDPASSTAHAEELDDAIAALRKQGIKVVCHLEDAGGKSLLACAHASKILLQPAGGVRFAGLRSQIMYYGEALRRLGIEPDIFRVREHKSAAEAFVRDGPTFTASADQRELLEGLERVWYDRIAKGRGLTFDVVKGAIAKGPFIADEAIAAGFVDEKAFEDEVAATLKALVPGIAVEKDKFTALAPPSFGVGPKIAIVYLDGDIVDGQSQKLPILGIKTAGSITISETLERVRKDNSIDGVLLRIESPGGSSLASDVMWRQAELLARAKPVVVSMGSVAASGGYYAAAFGAPIFASRGTITGSIGIFYGKADLSPLLGKLGIKVVTQKTAPHADAESLYRPFTDEERVELSKKVEQFYAVFLDRIARGRKMAVNDIDKVGRGKVWLGEPAKSRGLIDHVGGFDEAIRFLRERCHLSEDTPVAEFPVETNDLLDKVLELAGVSEGTTGVVTENLPKLVAPFARAIAPFVMFRSDQPLALWEGLEAP